MGGVAHGGMKVDFVGVLMKRRFITVFIALIACVLSLSTAVPASAENLNDLGNDIVTDVYDLGITLQDAPYNVTQGENYSLSFSLSLQLETGHVFKEGDTYTFLSNFGDLFKFAADDAIDVYGEGRQVIAHIQGADNQLVVTFTEAADGETELVGSVVTPANTALDVGATEDKPIKKTLQIGNAEAEITFNAPEKKPDEDMDPASTDFNSLWKNCWATQGNTHGVVQIEVNPEGSIYLYLASNDGEVGSANITRVHTYRQFFVKDEIPGRGVINPESVQIYASILPVGISSGSATNPHGYEAGTVYAVRQGTDRRPINGRNANYQYNAAYDRMELLEQLPGESVDEFEARVKDGQLKWGIYIAEDGTQTIMVNFGNIGPENNNGIKYEDYVDPNNPNDYLRKRIEDYPEMRAPLKATSLVTSSSSIRPIPR